MHNSIIRHLEKYVENFIDCYCFNNNGCQQKGEITWNNNDGDYTHIRIDCCVICDNDIKKCDCLIIFFNEEIDKPILYFIEFKGANYDLEEIQSQIQNAMDIITKNIIKYSERIIVMPVFYAPHHRKNINRWLQAYKVKYRGKPIPITHLKTGENIINVIT